MASKLGAGRLRIVLWLAAGAAVIVGFLDAGSIALTNVQVSQDAQTAGYEAVKVTGVTDPGGINAAVAEKAYQAAQASLTDSDEKVVRNGPGEDEDFKVAADGSVTLTVVRTAPTLLLGRVETLQHLARVTQTHTQERLGF